MSTMPPVHPAADKFPMMGESELAALADDIKQNGQRIPIQMIDGAILDGRNRWRACELAGVAPVTQNWTGQGSPAGYVLSINLRRRHLSPEQRAAIAAEFEEMFRQEARLRQTAALAQGPVRAETTLTEKPKQDDSQRALAQAAAAAGASLDSAKKIKAAAKVDPELLTMAREGQVKIAEATRLAAMPAPEREEAKAQIKEGKKPAAVAPPPRREPAKAPATPPKPRTPIVEKPPERTPEHKALMDGLREAVSMEHERTVKNYYFSLDRETGR